jgi:hypothetical protein
MVHVAIGAVWAAQARVVVAPLNVSVKITLPVGVPPPMLATTAVKVTGASTTEGFADEVRTVVVTA